MVQGTVVAPNITTYSSHTSYLTFDEWNTAATAIDIRDLVVGGTEEQQKMVVLNAIERASSWIDQICNMVLSATRDTHHGRYRVGRYGTVMVPLPNKPILEVSNIRIGLTSSSLVEISDTSNVDISLGGVVEIPVVETFQRPYGDMIGNSSRLLVMLDYVNGFPNTSLTSPASAAGSSITVASSIGVYPGTPLTIYDVTAGIETVVVSPSFTAGSTTVPLVGHLTFAHAAGVSVSNLPAVIKEATVLLTSTLIQTRGDDAIMLDSMDPHQMSSSAAGQAKESERLATTMLENFVRIR
jgi:hypothetical protein